MMSSCRFAVLIGSLLLLAVSTGRVALAQPAPLVFGVLNQQSPALTAERWNPILHYVASKSGVPLRFRMGATVNETNAMMGRGEFDLIFTNHNFQTEYDAIGYRVIARWGGDSIRSVVAVAPDSPITRLEQLAGKKVTFPSRDAFVGYAVPVVALKKAGVQVEEVLAGNQEGAMAQLKARRVEAAAVNSRFLAQYSEREGVLFRAIFTSEPFPELAVVAHPRVAAPVVDKVRQALLAMKTDPLAGPVLEQAKSPGFEAATDRDYDGVRRVYRLIGQ
jgi:ABC-type phosphate/phosphonate transport system substrate-binding protein